MTEDVPQHRLAGCQELIGYRFRNPELLRLALTHASDKPASVRPEPGRESVEAPPTPPATLDNERLEFLGDAVLGMLVCENLFIENPDFSEGELTAVKSVVVSRNVLAKVSRQIGLPGYMSLGKGMEAHDRLPRSLEADVFEAVVGAIYLDGGMAETRRFVLEHLTAQIELVEADQHQKNFKSLLQQYTQREMGCTPTYRVVAEEGPDHIKQFEVVAVIGGKPYATGRGKSKKDAEQEAAEEALRMLTPPATASPDEPTPKPNDEPAG